MGPGSISTAVLDLPAKRFVVRREGAVVSMYVFLEIGVLSFSTIYIKSQAKVVTKHKPRGVG
jgi:hypothetical protein